MAGCDCDGGAESDLSVEHTASSGRGLRLSTLGSLSLHSEGNALDLERPTRVPRTLKEIVEGKFFKSEAADEEAAAEGCATYLDEVLEGSTWTNTSPRRVGVICPADDQLAQDPRDVQGTAAAPSWRAAFAEYCMPKAAQLAGRLLGLAPLSQRCNRLSMVYRCTIMAASAAAVADSARSSYENFQTDDRVQAFLYTMDTVVALSSLMVLMLGQASWLPSPVVACIQMFRIYSCKAPLLFKWQSISEADFYTALGLWAGGVLWRAAVTIFISRCRFLSIAYYAWGSAVLIGVSSFILHVCRCLATMTDVFCWHLSQDSSFRRGAEDWEMIQSFCHAICTAMQLCFLVLLATMTAVLLLFVTQVSGHEVAGLLYQLHALVIAVVFVRTSIGAATVTEKCARVPMHVNSIPISPDRWQDQMHCVQHIVYSRAGLYVFGIRITGSTVVKTVYIACALGFSTATRML